MLLTPEKGICRPDCGQNDPLRSRKEVVRLLFYLCYSILFCKNNEINFTNMLFNLRVEPIDIQH